MRALASYIQMEVNIAIRDQKYYNIQHENGNPMKAHTMEAASATKAPRIAVTIDFLEIVISVNSDSLVGFQV